MVWTPVKTQVTQRPARSATLHTLHNKRSINMSDNRSILPEGTLAFVTLKEPLAHSHNTAKVTCHLVTVSFTDTVGLACHTSGFPDAEAYFHDARTEIAGGYEVYDLFPSTSRVVTFIPWSNIAGIRRVMGPGEYAAWYDRADRQSREAGK